MKKNIIREILDAFPEFHRDSLMEVLLIIEKLSYLSKDSDDYTKYKTELKAIKKEIKEQHPNDYDILPLILKKYDDLRQKNKEIDKRLNEAMISIRSLTANPIIVNEFMRECINHEAIEYIKNEMVKGNIPMEFSEADETYRKNIINIANEILFMLSPKNNGAKKIINIYNRTMGKSKEVATDMLYKLKDVAATLSASQTI